VQADLHLEALEVPAGLGQLAGKPEQDWAKGLTDVGSKMKYDVPRTLVAFNELVGSDGVLVNQLSVQGKRVDLEARSEGKVPAQYGWSGWPFETAMSPMYNPPVPVNMPIQTATALFPSTKHNFSFTTEVKYWFTYSADMNATFDFTGDIATSLADDGTESADVAAGTHTVTETAKTG